MVWYTLESFSGVGVVESHFDYLQLPEFDWERPPPRSEHPYWEYGGHDDQIVIVGLAWALTENTERYVIPHLNWKNASEAAGAHSVDHVLWEYSNGAFTEARSWEPTEPPNKPPWTRQLDYTGFFPVESLPELSYVYRELAGEAKRVNLFGLTDASRYAEIAQRLNAPTTPEMADLLGPGDWFIDLTWGYSYEIDRFTVATQAGGESRFEAVINTFRERIDDYEQSLEDIENLPDYMTALARLQGCL
jgi:hypothetical protein